MLADDVELDRVPGMSTRARNVLVNNMGLRTVGEVRRLSDKDLLKSENFGMVSLRETRELLAANVEAMPNGVVSGSTERHGYGEPEHAAGPLLTPATGNFFPAPDSNGPMARGEISPEELVRSGRVVLHFDCGIEGESGSWPFMIALSELSDDILTYDPECARGYGEVLARALETEAARIRLKAAQPREEGL